jgi:Alw26I/Eco31I/Esp3I family type II restriction m6 adenine DNA methyltransferase
MSKLRQRAQQLVWKKDRYMLAHGDEKQKLYDEITAEEKTLAEQTGTIVGEGVIAWHIHFAEVFTRGRRVESTFEGQFGFMAEAQRQRVFKITSYEPGGFDIVLANPPYGLLNKKQNKQSGYYINPSILQRIKSSHEFGVIFRGMANVCSLFIRRSFSLLSPGGMFVEIFPLSFTCDLSFSNLRRYILSKQSIFSIDAFPERDDPNRRVFYSAKMSVCILLAKRESPTNNPFILRIHNEPYVAINNNQAIISPTDINLLDTNSSIPLVKQNDIETLKKIYSHSSRLSNIGKCYTGEVDLTLCRKFIRQEPNYATMHKGAIIDKYRIRESMSQGEIEYLDADAFIRVKGKRKTSSAWHHRKHRIVLQGITGINERVRLKMTLLPPGQFCANSVNYILLNNEDINDYLFLLGVLNSKIANYVFKCFSTNSNVNGYEVDNLPIPKTSNIYKQQIVSLVQKRLDAKGIGCELLEKEIDQMVYALYGLMADEIAIVENSNRDPGRERRG